jgi:hypothetical protein
MVWEEPLEAVKNMASYAVSSHFKDQMVIRLDDQPMIVGTPLGQGCFQVHEPPYDSAVVAPHLLRDVDHATELQSYAWQDLTRIPRTEAQRQELLALQDQAVIDSVAYVKRLNGSSL